MEYIIAFVAIILIFVIFIWVYLFYRSAFTAPTDSTNIDIEIIQGVQFLVENHLPYPAGIKTINRKSISLSGIWDFRLDSEAETTQVEIPSCFNTAESPLRNYQGVVWYEKEVNIPDRNKGSFVRLAFMGSFYYTKVWLDDDLIGFNEGGYLPFYFDITNLVKQDQPHKLKVMVDNRIKHTSLPPHLFQGHNLGWHPYGGLHRDVLVEICPPVYCFKLQVDTDINLDEGLVQVSALFHRLQEVSHCLQTVTLNLLTETGQILAEVDSSIFWDDAGQYGVAAHTFNIVKPRFWEPNSPYLYQLAIQTEYENCETTFGFRDIQAKDGKLLLNGKSLILKGICRHQEDRKDGLAQGRKSVQNELETIKSLNGNFTRLAHYPHSRETLDLCDQLGLCVWNEIPLYQAGLGIIRYLFDKTKRDTGKNLYGLPGILWNTKSLGDQTLLLNARNELLKMIERDRNHPSVLIWGLGNECWSLNPAGAKALAWLRKQAEVFDESRLFSYAASTLPVLSLHYERSFEVFDVVSINEYFGWYYGKAQNAGTYLRAVAHKYPNKPLLVTETGSDTVRGNNSDEEIPSRGYSEEYQVWYLKEQWRHMNDVPTFAGLSIWVLKDFLCPEYREDNPVPFYNLKGLMDRDGQPKAAFGTVRTLYGNDT